jgi:tRNA (guanine-N7-)-methyltransferase
MLHLATDWQHYAEHMMKVLSDITGLSNQVGLYQYANRSTQRPVITKFEQRGKQSGRVIWELQFVKNIST